jgi:uncharacterized coiled-coil protein SlyX
MTKLTDTLELWLQEQINAACRGLFDRIDRLEVQRSRDEDAIRDLYRQVENQGHTINTLGEQVVYLEDRVGYLEACVDNQSAHINTIVNSNLAMSKRVEDLETELGLNSFTDRVCEVFDTEPFKTTVEGIVADWVADSDVVCSTDDVVRILEETTFKIRVR